MDKLGPISWFVLGGAVWIVVAILFAMFVYRLKRAEPKIVHKKDAEKEA